MNVLDRNLVKFCLKNFLIFNFDQFEYFFDLKPKAFQIDIKIDLILRMRIIRENLFETLKQAY